MHLKQLRYLGLLALLTVAQAPILSAMPPVQPSVSAIELAQGQNPDQLLKQGFDQLYGGDFRSAIRSYEQVLQLLQGQQTSQVSEARYNLGRAYLLAGEPAKAIPLLRQLSESNPGQQAALLSNLGLAYYQTKQLPEAEKVLREAIARWESVRSGTRIDVDQITLFEQQAHTYRLLQKVLVDRQQTDAALEISEWSRARAVTELLAQRTAGRAAAPPTLSQLREIAKAQNSTLVEYAIVGDEVRVLGNEPDTETDVFIWVIQPSGKITFRRVDLKSLRQSLNELNQPTVLSSLVRSSRTDLGIPSRGLAFQETSDSSARSIEQQARKNPQLQKLHQLLIQPIADVLPRQPEARVTFIPQGALLLVPFAALQDQQGTYLIERHTILTAPSIQVLALTRQQRERLSQGRPQGPALVVGNPIMPKFSPAPGQPPQQLASLPGSEQEAQTIATLLNTTPLIGALATKARVMALMPKSPIIHLATHGLLDLDPNLNEFGAPVDPNSQTARQSRVFVTPGAVIVGSNVRVGGVAAESALAREKVVRVEMPGLIALTPSPIDDGLLSAKEILEMRLQASLVVLSACNTGRGRVTGDGVVGLARSLIAAGTPSVIVSLWAVPDAPTATLMVHFYQAWQKQPDKAQALRQAMLLTMREFPDPRSWGAFTLIGEAN